MTGTPLPVPLPHLPLIHHLFLLLCHRRAASPRTLPVAHGLIHVAALGENERSTLHAQAWVADPASSKKVEWMRIDLGRVKWIGGVVTQGCEGDGSVTMAGRVTRFGVKTSKNGHRFTDVRDASQKVATTNTPASSASPPRVCVIQRASTKESIGLSVIQVRHRPSSCCHATAFHRPAPPHHAVRLSWGRSHHLQRSYRLQCRVAVTRKYAAWDPISPGPDTPSVHPPPSQAAFAATSPTRIVIVRGTLHP